ncbi:MAG: sensor histidine kinase, partial [Actinomycetales bacterium]
MTPPGRPAPGRLHFPWGRPEALHLRTRLVLVTLALLTLICCTIGVLGYAAMNVFLTQQLDVQLSQAAERADRFGSAPPPNDRTVSRDPLNAPGQGAGTLNARVVAGIVSSGGLLRMPDAIHVPLQDSDQATLLGLPHDGVPTDRSLSTGDYRLVAVAVGDGDIIITGLPLAAKDNTLASLVWVIAAVSVAGLVVTGVLGTVIIRRTLRPLEKLSAVATKVAGLPLDAGEVALAVRVPGAEADPRTEVGNVGHALNLMLDNVSQALQSRQRSETKVRRFVADASHELRTPLTAIRGYTELLRLTEPLTPQGRNSIDRVESQSKRMGKLVEDLLLLARLDEGRAPELKKLDLSQLLVETVSDAQVVSADHRWVLDVPQEEILLHGDAEQLRRVLVNLLNNAAKHTPAGTVVTAGIRAVPGDGVEVSVSDDGPGIEPEFQGQIFDRFARADVART